MLAKIVALANDPLHPSVSLSRLRTIQPSGPERSYLVNIGPFLSIDSVQHIFLHRYHTIHRVQREQLRSYHPTFGKGLEVIEIINGHICGDDVRMILSNASNLRCFRYNHQPLYHDRGDDWSIGDFTAAIEEMAFAL